MVCDICKNKDIVNYKEGKLCEICFSRIIEKKIRKNARINKLFSKDDNILIVGDLNEYFIEKIVKGLPIKTFKKAKIDPGFVNKNKINKIVINWTMDDEIINFLNNFLKGKKEKKDKKVIKLLKVVSDKDLELFAKIKKINFKANKKDNELSKIIENMTEKYPDTKEKLLNSAISLEKMGV